MEFLFGSKNNATMADLVQTIMEKMTIYLQDLETNGLFSHVW